MKSAITNFRDIGGIPVSGGTLVKNKFFRSGELVRLTLDDMYFLTKVYRIKDVYDFREKKKLKNLLM